MTKKSDFRFKHTVSHSRGIAFFGIYLKPMQFKVRASLITHFKVTITSLTAKSP